MTFERLWHWWVPAEWSRRKVALFHVFLMVGMLPLLWPLLGDGAFIEWLAAIGSTHITGPVGARILGRVDA
jgi:hypothetical protein